MYALFAGKEDGCNVAVGTPVRFQENTLEAVAEPHILFGFVAANKFGALVVGKGKKAFHALYFTP